MAIEYESFKDGGVKYLLMKLKEKLTTLLAGKVDTTKRATETELGLVMLNPAENVTLTDDGQLNIGGRLGQFNGTTGVFAPKSIQPARVADGSLLLTEASGTYLDAKSLAVSTGSNVTCRSAAAGSTEYRVQNTYVNRIACSVLMVSDGVVALNEADAKAGNFANVINVTINGAGYTPDSSPNNTATAGDIVIRVNKSVNPNAATTSIRVYPAEKSFSNLFVGQAVGGNCGASVIVGQRVVSVSGNACSLVGADIYNSGNGNAVFGRQHISRKNRSFLAGTGHDTSNARSESVAAVGQYSSIDANTLFAVGNGTNHTTRSNAFEVLNDGIVLKSPNGTRYKVTVSDTGTLTATAL